MATRVQTLVQLTDDLVEALDARARVQGVSRSELIRELLVAGLVDAQREERTRRMLAAYASAPQEPGVDAWGDLTAWQEETARRNLAALRREEGDEPW
jgi:metal-responsive CopG/Arc/MetJ family transcriptional regulator